MAKFRENRRISYVMKKSCKVNRKQFYQHVSVLTHELGWLEIHWSFALEMF